MKRLVIAALAAASVLGGGVAASAAPLHMGHGPVASHGVPGGFHGGPVGPVHPIGFHPGPVGGFHPGPVGGFHGAPGYWHGPHAGFGYHGWGFGAYLPEAVLAPAYFVADFVDYGLAAPPADFEWVQDGPNALLVNLDSGQVVQVVPNAFA
jgi:Ni/Co efflux regulator RcnB